MPELPEITVLARQMQAELVGKTFAGSEFVASRARCVESTLSFQT